MIKLNLPLDESTIKSLHAGDTVYLSGEVYTARDAAHKRFFDLLDNGEKLPFEIEGASIYYAGACPAKEGEPSGSAGPTTSARMNYFAPRLIDMGLKVIIGKGEMSEDVAAALKKNGAVYFAAIGGAGALYGSKILKSEVVAFPELLSEAVRKLTIENFPVIVAVDSFGETIYKK